ncbi:PAS modulated sigma54 specific transcriptional regulator, Fis family [Solidesulfovibrio fructosivorans JJ]]|uniref:PAS modulated sigma54 specific transcriptional regulator, Fis family n=1 Tax=Solidesulfovibrio fructosivorans JJ] TaxID=596151 RepID=E1JWA0_SOLFR|nr:sigma-54-dependent Fis family transcriptional regulator [Solidesulfovibrio fructosivorans]EFL51460.1 PAS modulated sigma54 specific transcriptional regulator, Fis family [Solidesulfovibrio fructosivorans JJ]]
MNLFSINDYWKTVVNTIQDGVMVVDPEGRIIAINSAFEEITGYGREELVGASCTVLNCNACHKVRDGTRCYWCVMFQMGHLRKQRCALTRKDGSVVHIVKNASVLKDSDGAVIGAVETMTDVTDLLEKESQLESYRQELSAADTFYGLIGQSPVMRKVYDMIANAAQSDASVIIYGESGTGKELVASAIHAGSSRAKKPFVKVNCAALNEYLLESELFGHVKGAYTGAHCNRAGRFEIAKDGDIFLDEIGDMPLGTQVKLLRVLEDRVIERVGDNKPIPVQARIISATNRDLPARIEEGAFRQDFYYRINVIPIRLPALRERKEDIPLLADAFFRRIKLRGEKKIQGITRDTMDLLTGYHWPGNVRELKSAFEYAVIACRGDMLEPGDLPQEILTKAGEANPRPIPTQQKDMDQIKKERLIQALHAAKGNQSEAARVLGISRTTIWTQIKRYKIDMTKPMA